MRKEKCDVNKSEELARKRAAETNKRRGHKHLIRSQQDA